jgi:hypothetical protein
MNEINSLHLQYYCPMAGTNGQYWVQNLCVQWHTTIPSPILSTTYSAIDIRSIAVAAGLSHRQAYRQLSRIGAAPAPLTN